MRARLIGLALLVVLCAASAARARDPLPDLLNGEMKTSSQYLRKNKIIAVMLVAGLLLRNAKGNYRIELMRLDVENSRKRS